MGLIACKIPTTEGVSVKGVLKEGQRMISELWEDGTRNTDFMNISYLNLSGGRNEECVEQLDFRKKEHTFINNYRFIHL